LARSFAALALTAFVAAALTLVHTDAAIADHGAAVPGLVLVVASTSAFRGAKPDPAARAGSCQSIWSVKSASVSSSFSSSGSSSTEKVSSPTTTHSGANDLNTRVPSAAPAPGLIP
jgi:hypothetical protein